MAAPDDGAVTPRLRNTGNVALSVACGANELPPHPRADLGVIAPGETLELSRCWVSLFNIFFLDGDHAVGDHDRLAFDTDGEAYFWLDVIGD
jgi:hypothetical protein